MRITAIGEKNTKAFGRYVGDLLPHQMGLGLVDKGVVVGAAVFSIDEVMNLEYIYADEKYRRKGGGTMLINGAKEVLKDLELPGIMTFFKEDDIIEAFLEKNGFVIAPASPIYSFSAVELLSSDQAERLLNKKYQKDISSCRYMKSQVRDRLMKTLEDNDMDPEVLDPGSFDMDISFFLSAGEDDLGILTAYMDEKDIIITMLFCSSDNPAGAAGLLSAFFERVSFLKPSAKTRIRFVGESTNIVSSLERILEGGKVGLCREQMVKNAWLEVK